MEAPEDHNSLPHIQMHQKAARNFSLSALADLCLLMLLLACPTVFPALLDKPAEAPNW